MSRFRLRTLGAVSLTGPSGDVALDEPRLVAFLVMLAMGGDEGASEDELLLRLTPDYTPEQGRGELARLAAELRLRFDDQSSVARTTPGYALAPGALSVDARLLPAAAGTECVAFLPDFRLPGSPEFREWLSEARWRIVPVGPTARRRFRPRRAHVVATVVLLVCIAAAAAYWLMPRRIAAFPVGDSMLLADVRNQTGDPELGASLLTAATISLQQSERLRLYPRQRLAGVYQLMQIANPDTALSFELARAVAERDHVRFVLGLQVDRWGDGFRVTARLVDASGTHDMIETDATAASRDRVLDALDAVLLTIRRALGESRRDLTGRRRSLPQVTTASLAALRSYADGSAAWSTGEYRLAGELWRRAVDLDTGFAMAYGALGRWHYYHHDRAGGAHYLGEALARANRLTELERLRLLDAQAGYDGQPDSSLVLSRVIAERYPGASAWYNLGTGLLAARRYGEAIAAFETALTFDSTHVSTQLNLATTARALHRVDDALDHYARAGRLDSLALYRNNINAEWGSALVAAGRLVEAESAFRKMAERSSIGDRARGLRSLGYLALWRGRIDESIALFGQASAASRQPDSKLSEARNRLLTAGAYRLAGREGDAGREVDQVLAWLSSPSFEPQFLAMIATSCMRLGRADDVRTVLSVLRARMSPENRVDSAAEAYVSGLAQLADGRAADALAAARRARQLPQRVPLLMLEAEAFVALGHLDSARVTLERLGEHAGFGRDSEDDWLRSHRLLGDVQLALRDTAGARLSYGRLVAQWRDSPTSPPDLVSARSQLAALDTGRR